MSGANHHWCACNKPWSKACHESAQQDNSTSNDVHDSRWWGNTRKENRNPSQGTRAGVTHDSCWVGILLRAYYERLFKLNCRWLTSRCMECAKYLVGLVRLVNWVANLYLYHNKLMKRRQFLLNESTQLTSTLNHGRITTPIRCLSFCLHLCYLLYCLLQCNC